ncbi:kinase-like domain-containing protein [Xylariaceae sp. FL1272]|nr:kinase-like domain-containing protein [Xylariaceae sp. FL1272]
MAPLSDLEQGSLVRQVLDQLRGSVYACSKLTKLNGGTANFLYRGALKKPLAGAKSIIVKVSTDFVAINRDFPLDVSRCLYEKSMLEAMAGFPQTISVPEGHVMVQAPKIHLFDPQTHTQILEDFADTVDLTTVLVSPSVALTLPGQSPECLGHSIGSWLRLFHTWTSDPVQAALLTEVGSNEGMRKLKCLITYDSFIEILERHPEVIGGQMDTLRQAQVAMQQEFNRPPTEKNDEARGLIHGDFWGGNVLLPNGPWHACEDQIDPSKLFIIDWENVQYGHRAVDIGGMLGDLYERNHFAGVEESIPIMHGFICGYGPLDADLAYRVAVHAGVQLICWYYRRDRNAPLPHPLPKVLAALRFGRDLIVKGWTQDRTWLRGSVLAPMFTDDNLL